MPRRLKGIEPSPGQADRKLHDAWIGGRAGNASEGGRAEASIGLRESRRVGDVKDFTSKLQLRLTGQARVLPQGDV